MESLTNTDHLAGQADAQAGFTTAHSALLLDQHTAARLYSDRETAFIEKFRAAEAEAATAGNPPVEVSTIITISRHWYEEAGRKAYRTKDWQPRAAQVLNITKKKFDGWMSQDEVPIWFLRSLFRLSKVDRKGQFTKGWFDEDDQLLINLTIEGKTPLEIARELTRRFPERKRLETNVAFRRRKLKKEGKLVLPEAEPIQPDVSPPTQGTESTPSSEAEGVESDTMTTVAAPTTVGEAERVDSPAEITIAPPTSPEASHPMQEAVSPSFVQAANVESATEPTKPVTGSRESSAQSSSDSGS